MPVLLIVLALLSPPLQDEERTVAEVVFEHRTRLSEEVLRSQLRTREGAPYDPATVDKDQKALGERYSVRVDARVDPLLDSAGRPVPDAEGREQVVVRFQISAYESVRRVEFEGNDELSDEELQDSLGLTARGVIPRGLTSQAAMDWLVQRVRERYREEGFLYAEIRSELQGGAETERVLRFDVIEGPKVHVDDIVFVGLKHFAPRHMRSLMETSESFLFFRNTYRDEALQRDLGTLEEFLRDEGYLDARVALEALEPSANHKSVDIVLRVDQGPRYTVGAIRFEGNENFSAEELFEVIELKVGQAYRPITFERDWERLRRFYGKRGFIRAGQHPTNEFEAYRLDDHVVDVTYSIQEDLPKRVRDVRIVGNTNTADVVIRRELFIYPGDLFDSEELRYSEDRLRASRLFLDAAQVPQVYIDHVKTDDPELEDILIEVAEGETGFLNFAAGVSSGAGFFFGVSVDKENFDITDLPSSPWAAPGEFFDEKAFHGKGQLLRLNANPGSRFANYLINFREPALFGPYEHPTAFDTSVYLRETRLRLYDEDRLGGNVVFSYSTTRDSSVGLGFRLDFIDLRNAEPDVPDIVAAEGRARVQGPLLRFNYRHLDSIRNPTDGFTVGMQGELLGGPFGGDVDAVKSAVIGEYFLPLYENDEGQRHFLQVRGAVAFATPYDGADDIPFYERYRAGGLSSPLRMRGFDFWGVGPHQSDEPVGGNGGVVINTDYVFPIYEEYNSRLHEHIPVLKGIVFFDQGSLASDWEDLPDATWRMSVGVGVRLRIPVQIFSAPLEIYYGVALNRAREDEREGFTLSLTTRF